MNKTKRSLLLCVMSILLFASVIMTSAAYASDNASAWQGGVSETLSGAGTEADPYLVESGDDLAYLSKLVAEGNTFSGKYVKLMSDIDMIGAAFYPIGYDENASYIECDRAFSGIFDGNGNTISGIFQSTSQMKGVYNGTSYNAAMGLFGHLHDAQIKNLVIDSFEADGEFADVGCVAAYASGNCSFVNIAVTNSKINTIGAGAGAIVGWDKGGHSADKASNLSFTNVTVDNTNVIGDKYDCFAGGMIGYLGTYSAADFDNCHFAATIGTPDSDYYSSGMLVGVVDSFKWSEGKRVANADRISAAGCTVYGAELSIASGYAWGVDSIYALGGVSENDGALITCISKFTAVDGVYLTGTTLYVSDVFAEIDGAVIIKDSISVTVDKTTESAQASIFDGHITVSGNGTITLTITDNYFCIPTSVNITVYEPDPVVKFNGEDKTVLIGTEIKVSDIFTAIADAEIDTANVTITVTTTEGENVATIGEADAWADKIITFGGVGVYEFTITDNDYCIETTAKVTVYEPDPVVKFDIKLPNVDKYLYRVGNVNNVTLGTFFASNGAQIASSSIDVAIENIVGNANGTFSANTTDWTQSTLKFSGTGVVKLTVTDNDYCIATELYIEVVNGKNITSAAGSIDGTNVVLLSNVKIASGKTANYINCTVYGNGFTFDVSGGMNMYESKQGHGIIIIKNATLDNLVIVGDVYMGYGAYSTQEDYTSAVDATSSIIQNCYIANCAAPVRGNGVTIINTTLYGGTVANLILSGNVNTLTDVTTVNYNDGRGVIGLGIVINDGAADNTKLVLNGTLKQYNYICKNDINSVPNTEAQTIFNSMFDSQFSAFHINYNGTTYLNTGIVSMNADFNSDDITDNSSAGYLGKDDVTLTLQAPLGKISVDGAVYTTSSSATVDNGYVYGEDAHASTTQGDYLPTPEFDLGDQAISKDGDDDIRYIIGGINGIEALYQSGDAALTLNLTKLMKVYKYNGVYYTVSAVCKDANGNTLAMTSGVVTLSESGNYTLVFTVEDNIFYGADGSAIAKSVTRTYEVPLVVSVKEASIPDATITVSSSNISGEYTSSGTDQKYKFYPMQAITSITDAGSTFNFKANIASTSISYTTTDNAFASATTITVTYKSGQVLTITLGKPSGLNSPSASNGGKTLKVATDTKYGIVVTSDGKIASSSAVAGTWPITGWSFKGTNQATVTNTTEVKISFTKPSTCITPDTLVTLADGTQVRVDALTGNEMLLVWNHETGMMDVAPIAYIVNHDRQIAEHEVITLTFSDGKSIKIIGEHVFYNVTLGKYMALDTTADEYIGDSFLVISDGMDSVEAAELVRVEKKVMLTEAYEVVSYQHLTCFTDGILSTSAYLDKLLNIFDIDSETYGYTAEKIAEDIATYGLYTYADFEDIITEEAFELYNAAYLKIAVGKGYITWNDILDLVDIYFNVGVNPIQ